jgi:hypothetical protein
MKINKIDKFVFIFLIYFLLLLAYIGSLFIYVIIALIVLIRLKNNLIKIDLEKR